MGDERDVMAYLKGWAPAVTAEPAPVVPTVVEPVVAEPLVAVPVLSVPVVAAPTIAETSVTAPVGSLRPRAPGRRPARRLLTSEQRREQDRLRARGQRTSTVLTWALLAFAVLVCIIVFVQH